MTKVEVEPRGEAHNVVGRLFIGAKVRRVRCEAEVVTSVLLEKFCI